MIVLDVVFIIIILILIYAFHKERQRKLSGNYEQAIKALMRQVFRWHIAAVQDEHPVIKMLHSNYAVGFVDALQKIATDDTIEYITGIDIRKIEKQANGQQDMAMMMFLKMCPNIVPDDPAYKDYLANLSKLHT